MTVEMLAFVNLRVHDDSRRSGGTTMKERETEMNCIEGSTKEQKAVRRDGEETREDRDNTTRHHPFQNGTLHLPNIN